MYTPNYYCYACHEHLFYCCCSDGGYYDDDGARLCTSEESSDSGDDELDEGTTPEFTTPPPRQDPPSQNPPVPIPSLYPRTYPTQVMFFGHAPVPPWPYIGLDNVEDSFCKIRHLYNSFIWQQSDKQPCNVNGTRSEVYWIIPYYVDETLAPVTIGAEFRKRTLDSGRTTTLQLQSEDGTQNSALLNVSPLLVGETTWINLTITETQVGFYRAKLVMARDPAQGTPFMVQQDLTGCTTTIPNGYEWTWLTAKMCLSSWLPKANQPSNPGTFNVEWDGSLTSINARGGRIGWEFVTPTDPLLNQLERRPYPVVETRGGAYLCDKLGQRIRQIYGNDVRANLGSDGAPWQLYESDLTNELPDKMIWTLRWDGGCDVVRFLCMLKVGDGRTFPVVDPPPNPPDPYYPDAIPAVLQSWDSTTLMSDVPFGNSNQFRTTLPVAQDCTQWTHQPGGLFLRMDAKSTDVASAYPITEIFHVTAYAFANSFAQFALTMRINTPLTGQLTAQVRCEALKYSWPLVTRDGTNYTSPVTISAQQYSTNRTWMEFQVTLQYNQPTLQVDFIAAQISVPPGFSWKTLSYPAFVHSALLVPGTGTIFRSGNNLYLTSGCSCDLIIPHHGHPNAGIGMHAYMAMQIHNARSFYVTPSTDVHTLICPSRDTSSYDDTYTTFRIKNLMTTGNNCVFTLTTIQPN
jgi:hypothetical protein